VDLELSRERRREELVVQLLTCVVVLHETGVGVTVLEGLRGRSEHRDARCLFLFTATETLRYAIIVWPEYIVDGQVSLCVREVTSISMVILDHNLNIAVVRYLSSRGKKKNVCLKHTQPRRRAEFSPRTTPCNRIPLCMDHFRLHLVKKQPQYAQTRQNG